MMAKKSCRHSKFWLLGGYMGGGYLWCPECGSVRQCKTSSGEQVPTWPRWIKPGDPGAAHALYRKMEGI